MMNPSPEKWSMQDTCGHPAVASPLSRCRPTFIFVELFIIGVIFLAAFHAVPLLNWGRSGPKWISGMAAFSLFPALAGALWGRPSRATTLGTAVLTGCLAVGTLLEPFPAGWLRIYETVVLALSSTVVFVSAGWVRELAIGRKWRQLAVATLILLGGAGAVVVSVTVFMFLE